MFAVTYKTTMVLFGVRSMYVNLSPCYHFKDVPNKVGYSEDVSYDHLKVFRCKAFSQIPQNERSKLDAKTQQCIFPGYGQI